MYIPARNSHVTIPTQSFNVTTAIQREIHFYQKTLEELRREKLILLSRAVNAEEKHVSAMEALKRERADFEANQNEALEEAKMGIKVLADQLHSKEAPSPREIKRMRAELNMERRLRQECEDHIHSLTYELAEKNGRIAAFDTKSSELQRKVADAMDAVQSAFSSYSNEVEKSKRLEEQIDFLQKELVDTRSQMKNGFATITGDTKNDVEDANATDIEMSKKLGTNSQSSTGRRESEQSHLISVLHNEVHQLQQQLVDALKKKQLAIKALEHKELQNG